ncbi:hypothetical protein [Delftia sp. RIT313]|uniref:hypothetical protein n=1 Tax=Delftia sp. RIT313 TaxID=1468410 RepID=UPI000450A344|nr:hypothetical protein [Delftia sp. RIT313]EZP51399.1 hypothetical protein BW39_03868 [Delftia sp. RIT313]
MAKVTFTHHKSGREEVMNERYAKVLSKMRRGTYMTRDLRADVVEVPQSQAAQAPEPAVPADASDGLDALSKEELHAIAKERGVTVHHAAGADKVRAALREAAAQ